MMSKGDVLRERAAQIQGDISMSGLVHLAGSTLPGLLLVMAALPSVLPLPGIGNLTGGALCLMAWSIWRGQGPLALPSRLARLSISGQQAARALRLWAGVLDWGSQHLRCRVTRCLGPRSWAWTSLPVAAMGVVIFLPLPLGNVLGAAAVVAFGLGHSLEDGLAVLVGWALSALTLVYSIALTWGIGTFGLSILEWVTEFGA